MTRWKDLRDSVEKTRNEPKKDWLKGLIVQIKRASESKICGPWEPHRIKQSGRTIEIAARDGATMKAMKREVPAIALLDLPALEDVKLGFRVTLRDDRKRIEQYTVSVVGKERVSGRSWYARIDLDAEQKGGGPCSHAMLHCHVGVDPNEDAPEARVPLPWLDPEDAIAWILATLDPRLEPI